MLDQQRGAEGISSRYSVVADEQWVSGTASIRGAVRFDEPGTYLVCGFFEQASSGAAQYAAVGPRVVVGPRARFRSCGAAGGRRHITKVKAKDVSCRVAKVLARRWGQRPRKRIGQYSCLVRAPLVSCTTAGGQRVTFRTRRGV